MTFLFTECILQSPLSDDDLLAVLDGEANEDIQNHLGICAYCSERLGHMRKLEQGVHMIMYRSDCPTADELADFVMEVVTFDIYQSIQEHLQACVVCREEVQKLQMMFTTNELPINTVSQTESFWQQLENRLHELEDRIVTLLVPRPLIASGQLRGAGDRERILNYENGSITVMLRLEKLVDGLKINGTIIDSQNEGQWIGGHAELTASGQRRFIAIIDDDENFMFEQVTAGLFELSIYAVAKQILRLEGVDLIV